MTGGVGRSLGRGLAMAATAALLCAMVLVIAFSLPLHIDAHQYLASAAFWADPEIALYRDYMHSQAPYQPTLLGLWTRALEIEGVGFYLEARLFNALWGIVFLLCLARILTVLSANALWGVFGLLAVFTSAYMEIPLRLVRNDMLPLALTALALLVLLPALRGGPDRAAALRYAAAGALLGIATMVKHSFAFPALGLFVFALTASFAAGGDRLRMAALPVALGGLAAGLPGLAVLLANGPNALYALVEFHRTAHVATFLADPAAGVTLADRLRWTVVALADLSAAAMGLCILLLAGLAALRPAARAGIAQPFEPRLIGLCLIMIACTAVSFPLAKPLLWQYVAPVLPFATALLAVLSRIALRPEGGVVRGVAGVALPAAAGVLVIVGGLGMVQHNLGGRLVSALHHVAVVLRGPYPDRDVVYGPRPVGERLWLQETMTGFTDQIDTILRPEARAGLVVATDMPAFPLEAGLGIYPELASMPFFYDLNDSLPPEDLARLHGVGPGSIGAWMAEADVRAVLVAEAHSWNKGAEMEAYAIDRNMACFTLDLRGAYLANAGRLYLDPALAARPGDCGPPSSPGITVAGGQG